MKQETQLPWVQSMSGPSTDLSAQIASLREVLRRLEEAARVEYIKAERDHYRNLVRRIGTRRMALFEFIDGSVGPFDRKLLDAWRSAGIGGACARCGTVLEEGWGGPECPTCGREYEEAKGCYCKSTGTCPDCLATGIGLGTRAPGCSPSCSTLCPTCCPDD